MKSFGTNVVLVGAITVFCISCKSAVTTRPGFLLPVQQWQALNAHEYTIDQKVGCFCLYAGQLMRVTVRDDTVTSVLRISDSTALSNTVFLSIDSLFGIILNPRGDSLVVRYNSEYGYPEYLDINPQAHPVDGGIVYETSNLQIR